jgi:hypothetical protein
MSVFKRILSRLPSAMQRSTNAAVECRQRLQAQSQQTSKRDAAFKETF